MNQVAVAAISGLQCLYNNKGGYLGVTNACFDLRSITVRLFDSLVVDNWQGVNSAGLKLYDNTTLIADLISKTNLQGFVGFLNFLV